MRHDLSGVPPAVLALAVGPEGFDAVRSLDGLFPLLEFLAQLGVLIAQRGQVAGLARVGARAQAA